MRGTAVAATLLIAASVLATLVVDHSRAVAAHDDDDDAPRLAAAPSLDGRPIVKLDTQGQEKGGIATVTPAAAPLRAVARCYGAVLALDRLTGLYNTALTDAAQVQGAQARLDASRAASTRAKNLLKVFPTAQAQAESAAATADIDAAGLAAAKAQADALRNSAVQDWGPVLGDAIARRAPLVSDLVQRRSVLLQLSVAAPGEPPQRIGVRAEGGATVEARLLSVAVQTDPRFPGVGYFYIAPAAPGLATGASVIADLPRGAAQAGLDVPATAVVWQAGKPWMYVRTAPSTFQRYEIDAAAAPTALGGYVVPAKTLPRDKPIVTAGAQILLSQEMHAQIPVDDDN